MIICQGKSAGKGIAIGKLSLFKNADTKVRRVEITNVEAEKNRFITARDTAIRQLNRIYAKAYREAGQDSAQVFEVHMMMLEDEEFIVPIIETIEERHVNAEYAVAVTEKHFVELFASMEDAYMQARAADLRDISQRLIANLNGTISEGNDSFDHRIICAEDLTPSETISMDKEKVIAFVTAHGSSNSHTAILARSMGIPALFGMGSAWLQTMNKSKVTGRTAIVDGCTGKLIIDPDEETLTFYTAKKAADETEKRQLQSLKNKENITLDGTKIDIFANIGDPDEVSDALANDAGGIGLFRSEFLYLKSNDYPTEEQQFTAYRKVLEGMAGRKVIIRTLDIGADKQVDYFGLKKEENPALGCRAIRICLTRPDIFKAQLRALYRASAYGILGILFPMITSVSELTRIKEICEEVKKELRTDGIAYAENIELGIMIETPAAALISDLLAPMVDFFSVGTNDLTQYTLACDRKNPDVEGFCDPYHEAVLRLIGMSARNAHAHGAWIGICGELAGDRTMTETFLRMGIDELSVSPDSVLGIRDKVRSIDLGK